MPPIVLPVHGITKPTVTSGLVQLQFQSNVSGNGPVISSPILHSLSVSIPPAVMLALLPAVNVNSASNPMDETKIDQTEDFALYTWATQPTTDTGVLATAPCPPFPRYKAVDVNTQSFRILVEPPYPKQGWVWYVRWWAFAAEDRDMHVTSFEPQISVIDSKSLNPTNLIYFGVPFVVQVVDHSAQAGSTIVNLSLQNSLLSALSIRLLEKTDRTFVTTVTLNQTSVVVVGLDGKQTTFNFPAGLSNSLLTITYPYTLRQGFALHAISASANLSMPRK